MGAPNRDEGEKRRRRVIQGTKRELLFEQTNKKRTDKRESV